VLFEKENNEVGCHLQTVEFQRMIFVILSLRLQAKKEKILLLKFIAEETFQTLINAEEDRHVIH